MVDMDACRDVDTDGVRLACVDKLFCRDGARGARTEIGGVDTLESNSIALLLNDEGGNEIRRFAMADGASGTAEVETEAAMLFLLLGTTVVMPLVVLETMEYARGFIPLDDVPAVVERDVDLDTRDGVSDGGLTGAGILG